VAQQTRKNKRKNKGSRLFDALHRYSVCNAFVDCSPSLKKCSSCYLMKKSDELTFFAEIHFGICLEKISIATFNINIF
jgi:hypothetical protein